MELKSLSPVRRMSWREEANAQDILLFSFKSLSNQHFLHEDKRREAADRITREYSKQRPVKLAGEWILRPFWRRQGNPRVRYFK